jgi:hypothetical protein
MPRRFKSLYIHVDAGSNDLPVIGCSSELVEAGVCFEGHRGLLDVVLRPRAEEFDQWVYEEVQDAPSDRASKSKRHVELLKLRLPSADMEVARAWLEIPCLEEEDDGVIPVTVHLSDVVLKVHQVCSRQTRELMSMKARKKKCRGCHWLNTIAEEDCNAEAHENESDHSSQCSTSDDIQEACAV